MARKLRAVAIGILLACALAFEVHAVTARYETSALPNATPQVAPEAALGTGFTYQGQLKRNGAAVNALCSFTFSLWDAAGSGSPPAGGIQIGGDQTVNAVSVSGGLFNVTLNGSGEFGTNAFSGEARWLQIGVICPGDSVLVTLSPRQPITPAPYALAAPGSAYRNVIVVAKAGGDFTSIQAALDSIQDAAAGNPYLVWVAPGVYAERVTMKPYVDIQGAARNATRITFTGSGTDSLGTVVTASNAELRALTVENTGGAAYAIAIRNNGTSPHLTDITAAATGDGNISAAVFSDNQASPTIDNANLTATGAGFSHYALYSRGTSTHAVRDSQITANGGSVLNYGVLSTVNSTANIHASIILGTTSAVHMLNSTGHIATSQLTGGATTAGAGTLVCVGAYDQNFAALNTSCQ